MKCKITIFLLIIAILNNFSMAAFSENRGEGCQGDWNPPSAGPVITWTAPLCDKGKFVVQPYFFYDHTRGTFDEKGNYDSLPEGDRQYQFQQQLLLYYGITDRLEIDTQIFYYEKFAKQDGNSASSYNFGDNILFLRYCAIEEKGYLPHVTGIFQFRFPSGKYQKLDFDKLGTDEMGTGSYDPGFGLILTKKIKPFILHLDFIYNFPIRTKIDDTRVEYNNYLNCDFGAEYFLPKGFNLMIEVNGFYQGYQKVNGETIGSSAGNYINIIPGIGWSCDKIQTLIAYQRTLAGKNADAVDSAIFTFVYTF